MQRKPFGTWTSPFTPEAAAASSREIIDIVADGHTLYMVELRPDEDGRCAIVRCDPGGHLTDMIPPPYSASNAVHTYGGGPVAVHQGAVFFTNEEDGAIYRAGNTEAELPRPLTKPVVSGSRILVRYADLAIDPHRNRLIYVCEDHRGSGEARREIHARSLDTGDVQVLVSGADFYAAPRISPDGRELAWIQWDHPNMPWDGTELYFAEVLQNGSVHALQVCFNGQRHEKVSFLQPSWSPDGVLHVVCDRTGWWNLYAYYDKQLRPIAPLSVEFARPLWWLGQATYDFTPEGDLRAAGKEGGFWKLFRYTSEGSFVPHVVEGVQDILKVRCTSVGTFVLGGAPSSPTNVILLDDQRRTLGRLGPEAPLAEGFIAPAHPVTFPTTEGHRAHGFHYPPTNPDFSGLEGELPPLIVMAHGGPTHAAKQLFRPEVQFWTSRGFAVLDVDYRGSTGYGRAYRELLKGQWGVYDVDDCVEGARYLVKQGLVDPDRLAIRGGSAGGFTVLATLTFRNLFHAGVSYYGIGDLTTLCGDTHGFESRYLYGLVPEEEWEARSPIHAVDRLDCPMLIFQGSEDESVPPVQSRRMVEALERKGIPCEYVEFSGEGHGFRNAANLITCLERELAFYLEVFGIRG